MRKINTPLYANIKKWLLKNGLPIMGVDDREQIICILLRAEGQSFKTFIKVGNEDFYMEFCVLLGLEVYDSLRFRKDIEEVNRRAVFGKFMVGQDGTLVYKYVPLLYARHMDKERFEDHLWIVKRSLELFYLDLRKSWKVCRDPLQGLDLVKVRN